MTTKTNSSSGLRKLVGSATIQELRQRWARRQSRKVTASLMLQIPEPSMATGIELLGFQLEETFLRAMTYADKQYAFNNNSGDEVTSDEHPHRPHHRRDNDTRPLFNSRLPGVGIDPIRMPHTSFLRRLSEQIVLFTEPTDRYERAAAKRLTEIANAYDRLQRLNLDIAFAEARSSIKLERAPNAYRIFPRWAIYLCKEGDVVSELFVGTRNECLNIERSLVTVAVHTATVLSTYHGKDAQALSEDGSEVKPNEV